MRKKISQDDARRFRKERDEAVSKLQSLQNRGSYTYAGTDLGSLVNINSVTMANLRTARRLNFSLWAIPDWSKDEINFRAFRAGE